MVHPVEPEPPNALVSVLKYYLNYSKNARSFECTEPEVRTTQLIGEPAQRSRRPQLANDHFPHAIHQGQQLVHEVRHDPTRANYVHKLLEMAIEQG